MTVETLLYGSLGLVLALVVFQKPLRRLARWLRGRLDRRWATCSRCVSFDHDTGQRRLPVLEPLLADNRRLKFVAYDHRDVDDDGVPYGPVERRTSVMPFVPHYYADRNAKILGSVASLGFCFEHGELKCPEDRCSRWR